MRLSLVWEGLHGLWQLVDRQPFDRLVGNQLGPVGRHQSGAELRWLRAVRQLDLLSQRSIRADVDRFLPQGPVAQ